MLANKTVWIDNFKKDHEGLPKVILNSDEKGEQCLENQNFVSERNLWAADE